MNAPSRIPSPRMILSLLVLAQVVFLAVHQLWQGLAVGLLDPLGQLILGGTIQDLRIGAFSIGIIISKIFSSLLTIIVGSLTTILLLRVSWPFIARILPDDNKSD